MANKNRILYLLQFLQRYSDEDHPVTTAEIREALSREGCPVTTQTLRGDVEALREAGYDIAIDEPAGLPTTYSYLDRELDVPELQVLIDAVSSSQFISTERSAALVEKLTQMAGPSHRDELQPGVMISEFVKTSNTQLLYTVQRIYEAIRGDRKITFQYFSYDLNKQRVARHDGQWYVLSPYVTIWRHDRYFLVGFSDDRKKVVVFRIDRMGLPKVLEDKREPEPKGFDQRDYTERIFNMYDVGPRENVTLRCSHNMIDHVIDYFGKDIKPYNITPETFDVRVRVVASATFFSWVMGYSGNMTVVGPQQARELYRRALHKALDGVPPD